MLNTQVHHDFLNPKLMPEKIDRYCVRRGILAAISSQLENFHGRLLDVGSGDMPYKPLLLSAPSRVETYIGIDMEETNYNKPNVIWDSYTLPVKDNSIDCAMATEVFEHCPEPDETMQEIMRVLKPGGFLFFTVPFLWPLHCVPYDEHRYTPFALDRYLQGAGFRDIQLNALGGWDTSLAQMIGLWVRRRPMSARKQAVLSKLAVPVIRFLESKDSLENQFGESSMIIGISGTARKPV